MAAKRPTRLPGFFATCWLFRSKIIFAWDFVGAAVITIAAYALPADPQLRSLGEALGGPAIGIATALVGVVVAGLAVIVALLDDEFLSLMDEATRDYGGIEGQLFPFWFVTATGVATILLGVALLLLADVLPLLFLRILFAALAGLLVWTALGVFNLVASLQATGVTRAIYVRGKRD